MQSIHVINELIAASKGLSKALTSNHLHILCDEAQKALEDWEDLKSRLGVEEKGLENKEHLRDQLDFH